MSDFRFDVHTRRRVESFPLDATDEAAARYEAEYVLYMFPLRLEEREGRLYQVVEGQDVLVTSMTGEVWVT
jgi:hypothetical protein